MNKKISKKWLAALVCFVMLSSGAMAETYRYDDEADEIATIQTALTTLKLYSGSISVHFGSKTVVGERIHKPLQTTHDLLRCPWLVPRFAAEGLYEHTDIFLHPVPGHFFKCHTVRLLLSPAAILSLEKSNRNHREPSFTVLS